ncbi:FAD-dependent oxidoreductase [Devosia sp. 2618]|uniref:FAD-dependent oxidoreductase n=1 Tax=Devosia sp. 2618 TaxID=3156454 RepID=UPI0033953B1A
MADILKPDLCVIGAGAVGISLAVKARQRGLSVVLLPRASDDNDHPAARLRRAAFMASAERAQAIRSAGQVGLDNAEPKPNFRNISDHSLAIAEAIAPRDDHERLKALGITILIGEAAFIDRQTLRIGETTIRARQFALATGSEPVAPLLPGLDQIAFFTPDTIADNLRKLSHLVVIGGDPAALELAQAYRRMGSMVTVVPQDGLLTGFDPELVAILLQHLRNEGVAILENSVVTAINPRKQGIGVAILRDGAEDALDASHILVAMGRQPLLDAGLLDKAKLRFETSRPQFLKLDTDGQTSSNRITALGGAAGADQPHIADRQASLLIERLAGLGNGRLEPAQSVRLVQTQPALAQTGLLEEETLRSGQTILRSNLAEHETDRAAGAAGGTVKLLAGHKGTIIGAGAVGLGASELIALLSIAATSGTTLGSLNRLALPQPSIAATLVDLAEQFQSQQPAGKGIARIPVIGRLMA